MPSYTTDCARYVLAGWIAGCIAFTYWYIALLSLGSHLDDAPAIAARISGVIFIPIVWMLTLGCKSFSRMLLRGCQLTAALATCGMLVLLVYALVSSNPTVPSLEALGIMPNTPNPVSGALPPATRSVFLALDQFGVVFWSVLLAFLILTWTKRFAPPAVEANATSDPRPAGIAALKHWVHYAWQSA